MTVSPHDHARCVESALARAERVCAERGTRLTALRRRVLELVWSGHRPRGAYQILEDLSAAEGKVAAAPTVYRALEFLEEQGLVHRIECLNAYVGCSTTGGPHRGQFLVCRACGNTVEIFDPRVDAAIEAAAEALGFAVETPVVEVRGLCRDCSSDREGK